LLPQKILAGAEDGPASAFARCRPQRAVVATGLLPSGARIRGGGGELFRAGRATRPARSRSTGCDGETRPSRLCASVIPPVATMRRMNLDNLLAAAKSHNASDLHLIAGVPPAYRINGEIIIAQEDALAEEQLAEMSASLLNDL